MRDLFIDLIVKRLSESKEQLKTQFFATHPFQVAHHFVVDDLLPTHLAMQIFTAFPNPKQMRLLTSRGELKLKFSYVKYEARILQDLHFAIQNSRVISVIEEITGIKNQIPDRSRVAGGISTFLKGHFVNPHIDSSHDIDKKYYQTVNLLYYVSPGWQLENGGNYELWDAAIEKRIIVPSLFNRLVVMETNAESWHAVSPVLCKAARRCVFNNYYSSQPPRGKPYYHAASPFFFNTLIRPRPEQRIRRIISKFRDTILGKPW